MENDMFFAFLLSSEVNGCDYFVVGINWRLGRLQKQKQEEHRNHNILNIKKGNASLVARCIVS